MPEFTLQKNIIRYFNNNKYRYVEDLGRCLCCIATLKLVEKLRDRTVWDAEVHDSSVEIGEYYCKLEADYYEFPIMDLQWNYAAGNS